MKVYPLFRYSVWALVATIIFSHAFGAKRRDWRSFSKKGSLSSLSKKAWAFNRSKNMVYCRKRSVVVKPDGKKDMTKRINDEMKKLRKKGGGTLKLTAGTYFHKGHIRIPSFVCLIGAGMSRTIIKLADKAPRWSFSGSVRSFQTRRVTVMNLTIDGNRKKQRKGKKNQYGRYGFFSELTNFLWLKNVYVKNCVQYGFDPHGSKKFWAYYLIVEKCKSDDNGLDGFTIDQTVFATISDCTARRNDRHGFNVVTGTQMAKFRRCRAFDNGKKSKTGYGLVAQSNQGFKTGRIIFEKSTASRNHKGSMRLSDVNDVRVTGAKLTPRKNALCIRVQRKSKKIAIQKSCCSIKRNRIDKKSSVKGKFSKC